MEHVKDERALIQSILAGQVNDFQVIIENHQKLVWHLVSRIVPQEIDREDICQEVFVKVFRKLRSFKFESKLSTWIGRIAYNSALNHIQKKKPELYEDINPEGVTIDSLESSGAAPDMTAERNNMAEILREEISKIPIQYRTIITLYHLEEMTYNEISEIMNLPEGTVKSHLFRARKLLKENLQSKYTKEDLCR